MRAAVLVGANTPLVIEDLVGADPGPDEVLVRLTASGVCHSDLHVMGMGLGPQILGHEGAGIVEAVGSEVDRVKVGDRVISSFNPSCGHCWFCLHDLANQCDENMPTWGIVHAHRHDGTPIPAMTGLGTFAETMTVKERSVVKINSDLPDDQLALIGCGFTTGVGAALNTAKVQPGSIVAVIGCGGVGQSVIQGAKVAGAARIVAVDPVAMKREQALRLGATDAVDPSAVDAIEAVRELSGGRGADYAIDAIGYASTVTQAYRMARNAGTIVIVGMSSGHDTFLDQIAPAEIAHTEKRILGSFYGSSSVRRDFQRFADLVAQGKLDLGAMVSRRIKLDEVNDAFRAMEAGEVIRTVIAL